MNIEINNKKYDFDMEKFQKMILLYNALEDGWKIKKINNKYILKKNMKIMTSTSMTIILMSFYKNIYRIKFN